MRVFCAYNQEYDRFLISVVEYVIRKYGDNLDLRNVEEIELIKTVEDSTTDGRFLGSRIVVTERLYKMLPTLDIGQLEGNAVFAEIVGVLYHEMGHATDMVRMPKMYTCVLHEDLTLENMATYLFLEYVAELRTQYVGINEYDAYAQGTPVVIPFPGDSFEIGGANVEILGPLWYHNNLNDLSLIIKVTYGETSFLITGDAEWEAEHDLLDAGIDLCADVLHVGHHGSNTSTSYQFLRAVAPRYGIISVGTDNTYGHPDEETLSRLEDAHVIVLRTDQLGTIMCYSDGTELTFLSLNSKGN